MEIKIRFLGAAQNVTGSRHLLEANGCRILVDFGLFRERAFQERNWTPFVVPPGQTNAVFLRTADRPELLGLGARSIPSPPRAVFIVHGEAECTGALGDYLRKETGWRVFVPDYREAYTLD